MKYLSVCSGIEAATVAWHGLGWTPMAFAEIEAFPAAVLQHHYPTVPNLGDLTKYREWPEELLAEVGLLVGGTPCQAFSVAGKRQSLDDERGNLSLIYVNLYHHINEVRNRHGRPPAIALWENVPGVLSTKDNAFGCFIGGLLGCDEAPATESGKWDKAGFLSSETVRVGYRVLDAQYFGVAQRRRRVFLVAVPRELVERFGEGACPSEILSLRESVLGNPPSRGAAWEGTARATAAGLTSSGRGVERPGESRGQDDVVIGRKWPAECAPTLDSHFSDKQGLEDQHINGGGDCSLPRVSLCLNAGGMGRQDWETETLIHTTGGVFNSEPTCFHPTQDPISSTDGTLDTPRPSRGGGQAVAYNIHTSVSEKGASETEWHTALRSRTPGQSENSTTTVVAFTQNTRDEVRQINGDGQIVGALAAEAGMKQTNYLAFANRTRDGIKVPEVMKDGVVPALTNPGQGGRADAVNVVAPAPDAEAFQTRIARCGRGKPEPISPALNGSEAGATSDMRPCIRQAMQVRRLTPQECEALQGFPIDYTDVQYRKKPAADGPRYRALGNSMAVPCMWWLGHRIDKATREDNQ